MKGYEIRNETIDYLKKMLKKRKNELVLKMPEIYIKDIQEAYSDGIKSGLRHHSYDYLAKTADLKKRYEKQKEINKELVDENEELKQNGWYKIFESEPSCVEYWDLPQDKLPKIENFYFVKLKNGYVKICELKYDHWSRKKCFYDLHGGKQSNVAEWLDYPHNKESDQ